MTETMSRWGGGPAFSLLSAFCFAVAVALRFFLRQTFGMDFVPYHILLPIGTLLIAVGAAFWIWAVVSVMRSYNAKTLCTTGPFGICRHPVYASWTVFIVPGVALVMNSWIVLTVPIVMVAMLLLTVQQEEAYLRETFGQEYADYQRRVPAVLPFGWLRSR